MAIKLECIVRGVNTLTKLDLYNYLVRQATQPLGYTVIDSYVDKEITFFEGLKDKPIEEPIFTEQWPAIKAQIPNYEFYELERVLEHLTSVKKILVAKGSPEKVQMAIQNLKMDIINIAIRNVVECECGKGGE